MFTKKAGLSSAHSKTVLLAGLSAIGLGLASAQTAHAQETDSPFERSGFYIGGLSGTAFDAGVDKFSQEGLTSTQIANAKTYLKNNSSSVSTYGLLGGYRYKVDGMPVVVGVEGDLSGLGAIHHSTTQTYTTSGTDVLKGGTYTFSSGSTANYLATLRGTAGYLVTPNLNLYATAGLAYGGTATSSDGSVVYTATSSTTSTTYKPSGSKSTSGYVFGVGSDYAISNTVMGRLEYLYVNVNGKNVTYDLPSSSTGTLKISDKSNGHFSVIRFILSYQF